MESPVHNERCPPGSGRGTMEFAIRKDGIDAIVPLSCLSSMEWDPLKLRHAAGTCKPFFERSQKRPCFWPILPLIGTPFSPLTT